MRLNRYIAAAGVCSRRKADALIQAGQVKINGDVCACPGARVAPGDAVEINGRLLSPKASCHVLLNKPIHTVSTASDPQGRRTVLDLLPHELRELRLFPVGRLDYFSEGLLLLTNDGALAQMLLHPRHHQPREYEATIRGAVAEDALAQMRIGMELEDGEKLLPAKVAASRLANGDTLLRIELRQGVNRQIRRMCAQLGLAILKLKRVKMGALTLGGLPPGHFRRLSASELEALRRCAAGQSGKHGAAN